MKNLEYPEISVIVPVYNVENYIADCIESILCQTFDNFELLLINDGSADSSGMICDEYKEKDLRIRVWHKVNSGVSAARNTGLDNALGKWIAFIDSDDWVDKDYLYTLYNGINEDYKGLVFHGFKYCRDKESLKIVDFGKILLNLNSISLAFQEKNIHKQGSPWSKLYNALVIKENNLRFDEYINFSEDLVFMLSYLRFVNYISFIPGAKYNYRILETGLAHQHNSYKSENQLYIVSKDFVEQLFRKNNEVIPDKLKEHCVGFLLRAIFSMYRCENRITRNERIKNLKALTINETRSILIYAPKLFLFKATRFLLGYRLFYISDYYHLFIFIFRYRFASIWKRIR